MQLQKAFATGAINHVTAIMGVLRDENLVGQPTTEAQYQSLVEAQYGEEAAKVLDLYPIARFDSPYVAFRTLAADSDTVCPAMRTDERLSRWITVYAYEIDDTDAPFILPTFPSHTVPNGSYHGAENQMLFPGFGTSTTLDLNQQVLANQMTAEWTTFARTGNPTATGSPIWPPFTTGSRKLMSLQPAGDSQVTTTSQLSLVHNCGFWDKVSPKP